MLAEHDLSGLSCVCMYVDHHEVYTPNAPCRTIGSSINSLTDQNAVFPDTIKKYMATEFKLTTKPHVVEVCHNADEALLVYLA